MNRDDSIEFGVSPQEFRDRYLERACYYRKTALRAPSFTWADLDDLLYQVEPVAPALQLFNEGLVPADVYTEPAFEAGVRRLRLNPSRFYAQMAGGATLVLNRVESYSSRLRRLSTEVARFIGHMTTGNAYVAFGGEGTFGKHWDTHDVVVLQLIGRKRWQIFQPTFPLPLSSHTTRNVGHACPPAPVVDCVLEAGDLLYVPRGWWHHAIPLHEGSLHLSVGVYLPSVVDYLTWLCGHRVSQVVEARAGLTQPALDKDCVTAAVAALQQLAANPLHFAQFQREIAERSRPSPDLDLARHLGPLSSRRSSGG